MNEDRSPIKAYDPYAALRYPEFRNLIIGTFLTSAALLIQMVVLGYELYKMTHDPLVLGLIGLAEAVPFIGLALFGGYLADRRDKRTLMQQSLLVIIAGSAILAWATLPSTRVQLSQTTMLLIIYGVIALLGLARGIYSPASSSLKAFLVPREIYGNSSTWSSTFWQAGAIVGPASAGFLYAGFGFSTTMMIVVGMLVLNFVLISRIAKKPVPVAPPHESIWVSLREGLDYVFSNKIILYAISLDMFSVLFGGVVAILPIFAEDILHVGAEGLGLMRAAPAVGAMLTVIYCTYNPPLNKAWRNLLLAVLGFGVATLVFALSKNFWLSVLALFFTGAFDSISVVIRQTIMQVMPPDHLRGRVVAVNSIFISSSNELGAFESGVAARLLGVVPSVVFGGVATLGTVAYIWRRSKDLFTVRLS
ncbi:MFS transporter [Stenotrophobium rhamnosiphilum]|uniref:Multidrug efflux pump Tap n=1 Tax=Stenotrophobium rhamnosiphilum TaxID=2029166 RepID=A0A2T5MBK4_9GAMM|nr:MFS transporter [Stenotrophobium rhamnosiphilum]PTU29120.1 MFS transporter [Stenotrophobium rhamnosiphilum]